MRPNPAGPPMGGPEDDRRRPKRHRVTECLEVLRVYPARPLSSKTGVRWPGRRSSVEWQGDGGREATGGPSTAEPVESWMDATRSAAEPLLPFPDGERPFPYRPRRCPTRRKLC